MENTVVIGGGFTGLYYAYRNKEAVVLSDKNELVKKTFKKSDDLYIFLRYNILTKKLLDELGIEYKLNDFTISYYYDHSIHKFPAPEAIYNYHIKSYGVPPVNIFQGYDINRYKVFTAKYSEVVERMVERIKDRVFYNRATGILIDDKVVATESDAFVYNKLISTIPLPILCSLTNIPELIEYASHLQAVPIKISYKSDETAKNFKTNQVLNMDPNSPIIRWVKPIDSDEYTVEFLGNVESSMQADLFLKYGKIIPSEYSRKIIDKLTAYQITPVGRFATWTPHYDTEDAIKVIDYMMNNR